MRYVSSFERIFSRRGMEKGLLRGMEKGMEQGIGKGQSQLLRLQIQQRFGALPADLEARLQGARPEQLQAWALRLLDAASLRTCLGQATGTDARPPGGAGDGCNPTRRRDENRHEAQLVLRQLQRRIGPVSKAQQARITALPIDDLETLGEALLDFTATAALVAWLARH